MSEKRMMTAYRQRIGKEQLRKATKTLQEYKTGKANLEQRLIASEQWWKMRHWEWMQEQGNRYDAQRPGAQLFNVIIAKHADMIQNYPQPNILPREEQDKQTAQTLSAIVPCVLEQNDFEETYSDATWQKIKQGTGIYGVFWDGSKLGGLGDILIRKIDALNLFWEPGITDIQQSANIFHVELFDSEQLVQQYPQLEQEVKGKDISLSKYLYDDTVPTENKTPVIDWYYHTYHNGKKLLHYVKYVGTTVIYASENDTEQPTELQQVQVGVDPMTGMPIMEQQEVPVGNPVSERGWYDHGLYPFVFDRLFPVEGSPFGFGYVDVAKHGQEQIDLLNQAVVKNSMMNATPRYMAREDGNINEAEFADWTKPIVHVKGNLSNDSVIPITTPQLDGNVVAVIDHKINEMKETTGNTDASNGITGGVTSASGIAAQQQASGKTSRAATMSAYRAFGRVIYQVIELIRQFYDAPRMYRIVGEMGQEQFVSFDNRMMQPQPQGNDFGVDMGYRLPSYDIKVSAQSKSVYTQNAQNEMAQALFQMGVFNPQMTDQSLLLLDMMDFEGKEQLMAKISRQGTIYQLFAQVGQIAMALAQKYDPAAAEMLSQILMQQGGMMPGGAMPAQGAPRVAPKGGTAADAQGNSKPRNEAKIVENARNRADNAARVNE